MKFSSNQTPKKKRGQDENDYNGEFSEEVRVESLSSDWWTHWEVLPLCLVCLRALLRAGIDSGPGDEWSVAT